MSKRLGELEIERSRFESFSFTQMALVLCLGIPESFNADI